MKRIIKIFCLVLSLLCISACSNNKDKTYNVYINNQGYNLGDEITLEINLKTDETNIKACPIINIEKEEEDDIGRIAESLNFSTENVEFLNLNLSTLSEVYNDNYWSFETILFSEDGEVDLSNGDTIEKINLEVKEKGKYTITLEEKIDKDCKQYGNDLNLNINN